MAKKKKSAAAKTKSAPSARAKKAKAAKHSDTKAAITKRVSAARRKPAASRPGARRAAEAGDWPREGSRAPDFAAVAHDGSKVTLAGLRGRPVVLYFYPKDDTPGCTVEACGFRDAHARFGRHRAVVIGVSPDSPQSHERFRNKHDLPFTLLADGDHGIATKYGAWRKKSMYGKTFMGVARCTFLIDAAGRIAKVFQAVKPAGHEREVLSALAGLG